MTPSSDPLHQSVLDRLRDGNRRFMEGTANRFAAEEAEHRRRLADGQSPDTVVLTCADSRVPPTLIFDQGLGDLFVIRVAGNVVSPEQLGSVEFAVDQLGSRLVVVLGHTGCGAVTAAVDLLSRPDTPLSDNLRSITDRIEPAAARAVARIVGDASTHAPLEDDVRSQVIEEAIRLNVHQAAADLRRGSALIDGLVQSGELAIVSAEYCLHNGAVELLD